MPYAVHDDAIVWGVGDAESEALDDARQWVSDEAQLASFETTPITQGQLERVANRGETSWPIVEEKYVLVFLNGERVSGLTCAAAEQRAIEYCTRYFGPAVIHSVRDRLLVYAIGPKGHAIGIPIATITPEP